MSAANSGVACSAWGCWGGIFEIHGHAGLGSGLLKQIAVKEKILYMATQRWRGGVSVPIAAKLRLDYGALVTRLVPPTPAIIAALQVTLAAHNALEAGLGGLYETHEQLAGAEAEGLLLQLHAAKVLVALISGCPHVVQVVRRGLARAGYDIEVSGGERDGRPRLSSKGLLV